MDPALMNDDQRREHFHALARDFARRYARLVVDALGGQVSADADAILYRIGFELGHDACQTLAREIRVRTVPRPDAPARVAPGETTRIHATTYTFTLLHPAGQRPADLYVATLEADNGDAVGAVIAEHTVPVPDADVPQRLRDLGNDGTFFDLPEGPQQ
jgi:hypothetical protein